MKAIIACDNQGGIGYQNKLPWSNIQGDLPRFKRLTDGQVIVMGRNTWESLPKKPLPGRLNFVVSKTELELPNGALQISNLNHFTNFKNVWLIGGSKLVNSSWHVIDEIHLSRTFAEYTCDTFIDLIQLEMQFVRESVEICIDHTYEIWKRK